MDGDTPLHIPAHVDVDGLKPASQSLTVRNSRQNIRPITLVKLLHRYSYSPLEEIVDIITQQGVPKTTAWMISQVVADKCLVWTQSGLPTSSKTISITHVFEVFNQENQVDFMFANVRKMKYCILQIVDAISGYSEMPLSKQTSEEVMAFLVKAIWVHKHGAPVSFSADSEFTRGHLLTLLNGHNMKIKDLHVQLHNETVTIDRETRTEKKIL